MRDSGWQRIGTMQELQHAGRKVFRFNGRQIVIFQTIHGFFACNNRCPHEGYPLREGRLDGPCILTCNWHNWKFNLETGENLYGGDRLRTYPIQIRDQELWIDLTDPPFQERYEQITHNLREAYNDNSYDRMGRELARLELLGADPVDAVRKSVLWSYDRMEFGWTHAFAGAPEWLMLYDESAGDQEARLVCLLEIVAHLADDVLRETAYPFPDGQAPYDEDEFVAAIENEDEPAATALLRGALADGLGFPGVERGLVRAALAHYNDFGHSLIYTLKAGRLIRRLGDESALPLLLSLVRSLVYSTREDMIPEFRQYARLIGEWGRSGKRAEVSAEDYSGLSIDKSMELALDASSAPVDVQYNALLGANARNMLAFDLYYQEQSTRPVQDNIGWLDFTHGLTFGNAVRNACTRFPEMWPHGLLQMACFCGRNAPYVDAAQDVSRWRVENADEFIERTVHALFDHGRDEFIVSVHVLKTVIAVRDELAAGINPNVQPVMLSALNRFLHEPLKRKHSRRTARQSINFVSKDG